MPNAKEDEYNAQARRRFGFGLGKRSSVPQQELFNSYFGEKRSISSPG